jgi:serine/threonine-protein kinase
VRVNVMAGPEQGTVPNVVGLTAAQATDALRTAGFNPNPSYVNSDATKDQVIHQDPAPNTTANKGTTVNIQISNGPPQVTVPSVVGETAQQAVGDLEAQGFVVNQQTIAVSDPSEQGIVQAQNPDGGTSATKGATVTIEVGQHSPGPPPGTTTTTTTTTPTG